MAAPAVAQVGTSSSLMAALPRGTTTYEVSSEVTSQNKSDEGPNKNGGKKKPSKKRKRVDVEDVDSEDIEVPIDITESIIKPLPKGLTVDHLHKHLIVQQFKLTEMQTAFFKMMCGVVGQLKMYLNNKSKVQGQPRRDTDHQYHCDDIME